MNFENQIVIITGGGSGIGAAASENFGKMGATVIVSDINLEEAEKVAKNITAQGGKAEAIKTNVAKFEEVAHLVQSTVDKYGRLDVLVNNAGIGPRQMLKVADHTLEDWDRVIAVNQSGVFYGMKCALKQMEAQQSGNIVNIASLAGLKASGKNLSYSASKFAVVGMTKSAALEYAKQNIRINAVCPGYTETNLLDQLLSAKPDMEQRLLAFMPMGRFGTVEEIANAITWLASDQSSFITGQTITLDGGSAL